MRIPRLLSLRVGAVAALSGAALLAGCGAAPGSVSGAPQAQKLVAAGQQLRGWDAARTTLVFDGSGQLGTTTLPCMSVVSSGEPVESFALQLNKAGSSSSGCREASATDRDVVTVLYEDGTLYVADAGPSFSQDDEQCEARFTGHRVAGDLADEFLASSTEQASLDDLLKAATTISGTDTRIELELDPATVIELGADDVPAGPTPTTTTSPSWPPSIPAAR